MKIHTIIGKIPVDSECHRNSNMGSFTRIDPPVKIFSYVVAHTAKLVLITSSLLIHFTRLNLNLLLDDDDDDDDGEHMNI